MKKITNYIAGVLMAAFTMTACSPEEFEGANGVLPQASEYADNFKVTVDQATNYAYFEFIPAPGVTPVWIIDGSSYSSAYSFSKYYRKKGTYSMECKVKSANGLSDGTILKEFIVEKTKMNGFPGFVEDSDFNLFKGMALPEKPVFWYAPGWSQIADPACTLNKGAYTVKFPEATSERWQAQMAITTDVTTSADKHYDFSVIMTSDKAHKGVKVKLCDPTDQKVLLDQDFALEAGEPKALWASNLEGLDISQLKMVFDFGGNEANTEINIESFVLKDHANDDGTEVPEQAATPFDYNDAGNMWKAVDEAAAIVDEFWFGDAGWGTIECNPEISHAGSQHVITIPVETPAEEWHAQWKLHTELSATTDDVLDFSLKVKAQLDGSSVKLPGMTVKFVDSSDDGNAFFAERKAIPSDGYVFRMENAKLGKNAEKLTLVFDFGGAPKGAVITIDEITAIKK